MTASQVAILAAAAFAAGALNAVAGGGSFLSFPALLLVGVAPVAASATNSFALLPAAVASAFAYREDLGPVRRVVAMHSAASVVGALLGAFLLLRTGDATFERMVPFLLLAATLLFTYRSAFARERPASRHAMTLSIVAQVGIAIYGGYFGGGMSILVLGALSLAGLSSMHSANGAKAILGAVVNGTAVVAFALTRSIAWGPALVMAVTATVGGFASAATARRIDGKKVRVFVLVVAWAMTAGFFLRALLLHR